MCGGGGGLRILLLLFYYFIPDTPGDGERQGDGAGSTTGEAFDSSMRDQYNLSISISCKAYPNVGRFLLNFLGKSARLPKCTMDLQLITAV